MVCTCTLCMHSSWKTSISQHMAVHVDRSIYALSNDSLANLFNFQAASFVAITKLDNSSIIVVAFA